MFTFFKLLHQKSRDRYAYSLPHRRIVVSPSVSVKTALEEVPPQMARICVVAVFVLVVSSVVVVVTGVVVVVDDVVVDVVIGAVVIVVVVDIVVVAGH